MITNFLFILMLGFAMGVGVTIVIVIVGNENLERNNGMSDHIPNPFGPITSDPETEAIMDDPQPGDRLSEMYSFWVYVVARAGDNVITMEASPPCTFPDDGIVRLQIVEEFRKRFAYGSIPGFWVRAAGRGHNVDGWLEKRGGIHITPLEENK